MKSKTFKKLIAIMLSAAMLISCMPNSAFADDITETKEQKQAGAAVSEVITEELKEDVEGTDILKEDWTEKDTERETEKEASILSNEDISKDEEVVFEETAEPENQDMASDSEICDTAKLSDMEVLVEEEAEELLTGKKAVGIEVENTEELQTALDSAELGADIILKEGNYGTVYLRNNSTETNRIMENVTVRAASGEDVSIEQIAYEEKTGKTLDIESLIIDGLTFSDAEKSGVLFNVHGSRAIRVNGLTVSDCSKTGDKSDGSLYDNAAFIGLYYDGEMSLNTAFAGDAELTCGYHDIKILNNEITSVLQPIKIPNDGPLYGLTVSGNTFTDCLDNHLMLSSKTTGTITIESNSLINMTGRFARISGAQSDAEFIISGNTVSSPAQYDTGGDGDIIKITGTAGFTVTESDNEWVEGSFRNAPANSKWIADGAISENENTGKYYSKLQGAVDEADSSETVLKLIMDDTECISIPCDKSIVLDLNGCTLDLDKGHIVDCGDLTVKDSSTEETGKITNGSASKEDGALKNIGGAVVVVRNSSSASFTLESGTIENCTATSGGAVYAAEGTEFSMGKDAVITDCMAVYGGAVNNYKAETEISGTIKNCTAANYGGAIFNTSGAAGQTPVTAKVTLDNGADIKNCFAKDGTGMMGGGVFNRGALIMNKGAVIEGCLAKKGAGVHNDGSSFVSFTMNGGEIKNNSADVNGGGVQNSENAVFNFYGGSINGNLAKESFGGGVFTKGKMTLKGTGNIKSNKSGDSVKTDSNLAVVLEHSVKPDGFTGKAGVTLIVKDENYKLTTGKFAQGAAITDKKYFSADNGDYFVKYDRIGKNLEFSNSINVQFDTKGGTAIAPLTDLSYEAVIEKPEDPARDNSIFTGWYLDGKLYDFSAKLTDDALLEAGWIIKRTAKNEETTIYNDGNTSVKIQVQGAGGIEAAGLEAVAESTKNDGSNDDNNVKIVLNVQKTDETSENMTDVEKIRLSTGQKVLELLEIDLKKYINGVGAGDITDTGKNVIEVIVPFNTSGKQNISVCRNHEGTVKKFVNSRTKAEGTFYAENNEVHIFTKLFSIYAIAYEESGNKGASSSSSSSGRKEFTSKPAVYSEYWYQNAVTGTWRVNNRAGQAVANAWLCDDAVMANGRNIWYLIDKNGDMISFGLIQDKSGNYYSLETAHNGHYGMLRYTNGTYDCNGVQVYLEFEQNHNGTFGVIKNQEGIEKLKAIYGLKTVETDSNGMVYTSAF